MLRDSDRMALTPSALAGLRAANSRLSLSEWRNEVIEPQSLPRAVFVELTQGCNLKCPMCRGRHIRVADRRMSDDLFQRVAQTLFPTAELVDLRGWGESLILPEISQRIDAVVRYGAALRIVTNLSFRRDYVLDQLAYHGATVDVSIDTACAETLAEVRGGARLDLIDRNLRYLLAKPGMAAKVTILAAVQRRTIEGLPQLIEFAAARGVERVRLFPVTSAPGSKESLEGHESLIDEVLESLSGAGPRVELGGKLGSSRGSMGNSPCIHPWSYCYVSYSGGVGFCDHLIGEGNESYIVGNMYQQDFSDIWRGQAMQELRKEHLGKRRASAAQFEHCAWCYKNKFVDFEEMFAPDLADYKVSLQA